MSTEPLFDRKRFHWGRFALAVLLMALSILVISLVLGWVLRGSGWFGDTGGLFPIINGGACGLLGGTLGARARPWIWGRSDSIWGRKK